MVSMPIVYTIQGCDACVKLLDKWNADGVQYEERRADLSQEIRVAHLTRANDGGVCLLALAVI